MLCNMRKAKMITADDIIAVGVWIKKAPIDMGF